jgi:hypothetical protein
MFTTTGTSPDMTAAATTAATAAATTTETAAATTTATAAATATPTAAAGPHTSEQKTPGSLELPKIKWASVKEYTMRLVQCCTENAKIRDGLFFDPTVNGKSNPSGKPKEHWYRELARVVFADLPGVNWENKDHMEKLQSSICNRLQT